MCGAILVIGATLGPRILGIFLAVISSGFSAFGSCGEAVFDRAPKHSPDVSQLLQKAERGDPHAQFEAGVACESGVGIERDYAEAVRWYGKAANSGDAGAQNNLGSMYGRAWGLLAMTRKP